MPLSGLAVAEIGVGGVVLYSGIKGYSLAETFTWLLKGTAPQQSEGITAADYPSAAAAAGSTAAAGDTGASSGSAAANQSLAKQLLNQMGLSSWTSGSEWADLVSLWNQESGWSATAANPTSNARGIAQNINGWSSSYQNGNAAQQITWGINYIEQRYGSPTMAWGHETANGWY
jgi:hypothetical protein